MEEGQRAGEHVEGYEGVELGSQGHSYAFGSWDQCNLETPSAFEGGNAYHFGDVGSLNRSPFDSAFVMPCRGCSCYIEPQERKMAFRSWVLLQKSVWFALVEISKYFVRGYVQFL